MRRGTVIAAVLFGLLFAVTHGRPARACSLRFPSAAPPSVTEAPPGGVWWVTDVDGDVGDWLSLRSEVGEGELRVEVLRTGAGYAALGVPIDAPRGTTWAFPGGPLIVTDEAPLDELSAPALHLTSESSGERASGAPLGSDCGSFGPYPATVTSIATVFAQNLDDDAALERLALDAWVAPADAVDPRADRFRVWDATVPQTSGVGPGVPVLTERGIAFVVAGDDQTLLVSARLTDTFTGQESDVEEVEIDLGPQREELRFACASMPGAARPLAALGVALLLLRRKRAVPCLR